MSGRSQALASREEQGGQTRSRSQPEAATRAQALQEAAGNQATASLLRDEAPLTAPARSALERAYGVDLGRVRMHSGPAAAERARAEGALAFTRGDDVYLGEVAGEPRVVRHELAHVLQQAGGAGGPTLTTDALEQEAEAGAEVTVGAAAPGSVQRWSWPWEEEEKQGIDPAAKQRLVDALSVDKSSWKRHLDSPTDREIMRTHSQIQLSYADDSEFQKWMKDSEYRPPGATSQPAVGGFSGASEALRTERAAQEAMGPITPLPREGSMTVAKPPAESQDWATANNRMTVKQRAKAAYDKGTGARHKKEAERHGELPQYVGALEKSLLGMEQGLKSVPFIRASVPIVQAVTGGDILGRDVSRWHAAGEALENIVLDFGSLLAPEDLMALGGEGKAATTAEEGLAGAASLGEEGSAKAVAATSEDVVGTTTGMTRELEQGSQRAIPLDPDVEPLTETMLESNQHPPGPDVAAGRTAEPLSTEAAEATAAEHPDWAKRRRSKTTVETTQTQTPLKSLGQDVPTPKQRKITDLGESLSGQPIEDIEGRLTLPKRKYLDAQEMLKRLQQIEEHHLWPKYLGGLEEQTLRGLSEIDHQAFHASLKSWKGGMFDYLGVAPAYKTMPPQQIIAELREFYATAAGGRWADLTPDLERAIEETLAVAGK